MASRRAPPAQRKRRGLFALCQIYGRGRRGLPDPAATGRHLQASRSRDGATARHGGDSQRRQKLHVALNATIKLRMVAFRDLTDAGRGEAAGPAGGGHAGRAGLERGEGTGGRGRPKRSTSKQERRGFTVATMSLVFRKAMAQRRPVGCASGSQEARGSQEPSQGRPHPALIYPSGSIVKDDKPKVSGQRHLMTPVAMPARPEQCPSYCVLRAPLRPLRADPVPPPPSLSSTFRYKAKMGDDTEYSVVYSLCFIHLCT